MKRALWLILGLVLLWTAAPLSAQATNCNCCQNGVGPSHPLLQAWNLGGNLTCVPPAPGNTDPDLNCSCNATGFQTFCQRATFGTTTYVVTTVGSSSTVIAHTPLSLPDNHRNAEIPSGFQFLAWPTVYLFAQDSPPPTCPAGGCPLIDQCGNPFFGAPLTFDNADMTLSVTAICSSLPNLANGGRYSLSAYRCGSTGTEACVSVGNSAVIDLSPTRLKTLLNCPIPPPDSCSEGSGGDGGAPPDPLFGGGAGKRPSAGSSADSCKDCVQAGGPSGCSQGVFGRGPSCSPAGGGPGAHLRYHAKSVGSNGMPGATAWKVRLGRNWSHDYAERIVLDPDASHVWLLTRYGTFKEFRKTGTGTGVYPQSNTTPSDDYRQLSISVGGTTSWQLRGLDGTVQHFTGNGSWDKTVDRNGNTWQALYEDGANPTKLTRVTFPDGRQERFIHDGAGKLFQIHEDGVGGSPTRTWSYNWSGDDLIRIARPDGTAWEFFYDDAANPGFLTRLDLIGTDGTSRRSESTFEYDAFGNTSAMCRGDIACTGVSAVNPVDKITFAYTNPQLPTQTIATHFLTNGVTPTTMPVTYTIERDPRSIKARVKSMSGDCGSCGLSPNTTFEYNDAANPLRPTAMVDGNGNRTEYTYNANGLVLSKIEAKATTEQRTLTRSYGSANFPAFTTQMTSPSSDGISGHLRSMAYSINPSNGNLDTRTIDGFEAGAAFPASIKTTTMTYNAAGATLTVDPPGFSASDQGSATYDPTRGNLLPLTRTAPLVGTTSFTYDGWNRTTRVVDPNLVITDTTYDLLNRITEVARRNLGSGSPDAGDLVTKYHYDCPAGTPADGVIPCRTFRDLRCIELPNGNGIESIYDAAGRLVQTRRKANCLPATQPFERTVYTLDVASNRTLESLETWSGTAWVAESQTQSSYTTTCHVDKIVRGLPTETQSTTEYCYDKNNNLQMMWDANHPRATFPSGSMTYAYDALDRLKTASQPWGGSGGGTAVTSYAYDPQDHLRMVIDANNNMTTYETSDRDLMTSETSPVYSGATPFITYTFDAHGNPLTKTDPRGITATYTHDAADRMTRVVWPTSDLETSYTFDAVSVPFSKGRLTSIARTGSTVNYEYDRFGRTTRDGAITYTFDKNGNRTTTTYSPTVALCHTYDAADRPLTLKLTQSGGDPCLGTTLASGATYLPGGPLSSVTLGNGLVETRAFDSRYYPQSISVPRRLDWNYSEDLVGNITSITDALSASGSRTYGYQDYQYFLTSAVGPWGTEGWTYDRLGNRLTALEPGEPTVLNYSYLLNGTGGRTPKLIQIQPRPRNNGQGQLTFTYDAAGNQTQEISANAEGAGITANFTYSNESKLAALANTPSAASTTTLYDGRGFLRDSFLGYSNGDFEHTEPTYASEGMLYSRRQRRLSTFSTEQDDNTQGVISADSTASIFYFAGRPIAQLTTGATGPASGLIYLTTDHLGTPTLATNNTGGLVWSGGFMPFGAPYQLMLPELFLRLPGQWTDRSWEGVGSGSYYNVNRWISGSNGRYTQPDPAGLRADIHLYRYVRSQPLKSVDPLGLFQVDTSCACNPPGINIGRAISNACGYLKNSACLAALRARNLEACFQEKCKSPHIGGGSLVRCESQPQICGQFFPNGVIVLYTGENADCPRQSHSPTGMKGPRDFGQTLFHEIGHSCGVPANEPSWWQQIQTTCTGWPL